MWLIKRLKGRHFYYLRLLHFYFRKTSEKLFITFAMTFTLFSNYFYFFFFVLSSEGEINGGFFISKLDGPGTVNLLPLIASLYKYFWLPILTSTTTLLLLFLKLKVTKHTYLKIPIRVKRANSFFMMIAQSGQTVHTFCEP